MGHFKCAIEAFSEGMPVASGSISRRPRPTLAPTINLYAYSVPGVRPCVSEIAPECRDKDRLSACGIVSFLAVGGASTGEPHRPSRRPRGCR